MIRGQPRSTLVPYTTLFRSSWTLADLEVDAGLVGLAAAGSQVVQTDPRPPKEAGRVVNDDDGAGVAALVGFLTAGDRKSTRLNSSHANISYAVFCLKKKKQT